MCCVCVRSFVCVFVVSCLCIHSQSFVRLFVPSDSLHFMSTSSLPTLLFVFVFISFTHRLPSISLLSLLPPLSRLSPCVGMFELLYLVILVSLFSAFCLCLVSYCFLFVLCLLFWLPSSAFIDSVSLLFLFFYSASTLVISHRCSNEELPI